MLEVIEEYYIVALCGGLLTVMGVLIKLMFSLYRGVRSLLRKEIIDDYNTYINKEYIPIYALENTLDMYNSYHMLGGNGTCTKIVEELKKLPSHKGEN